MSGYTSQEVCPWNGPKFVQLTMERDYRADWREAEDRPAVSDDLPGTEAPSLVELMRMTREEWDVWTRGSAMRRAGYAGFRRNVAVAMGNWLVGLGEAREEAVSVLTSALSDPDPLVRGHAAWALGRVDSGEAREALERALASEADPFVRKELGCAVAASPVVK